MTTPPNTTPAVSPATDEEIADTEARAHRVTGIGSVRALKLIARIRQEQERVKEARAFAELAAEKYNDLLARGNTLTCAFCGMEYPDGTLPTQHEALTAHIRTCEKHPLRAELAACREVLRRGLLNAEAPHSESCPAQERVCTCWVKEAHAALGEKK